MCSAFSHFISILLFRSRPIVLKSEAVDSILNLPRTYSVKNYFVYIKGVKMSEKIKSDEKLMSLLSHLSIIIPNIGVIAPIIIWVTQKDKSKFVRFHAVQAIFFQLLFFVLLMASIFIGLILMLISLPIITRNPDAAPGALFWVSMGVMNLYFPLWIIFAIYAVVAGVKSFKGRIFRYLIIGRIIEKKVYK